MNLEAWQLLKSVIYYSACFARGVTGNTLYVSDLFWFNGAYTLHAITIRIEILKPTWVLDGFVKMEIGLITSLVDWNLFVPQPLQNQCQIEKRWIKGNIAMRLWNAGPLFDLITKLYADKISLPRLPNTVNGQT